MNEIIKFLLKALSIVVALGIFLLIASLFPSTKVAVNEGGFYCIEHNDWGYDEPTIVCNKI